MANDQEEKTLNKLNKMRSLSYLLDESIPIPGTSYRIGIDPILGLIPAAGDYLGVILSLYIVIESAKLGASKATLSRMVFNILFDSLLGTVPVLGDLFDAGYKSNKRNLKLLENHLVNPTIGKKVDWWFILLIFAFVLLCLLITTAITLFILTLLFKAITGG